MESGKGAGGGREVGGREGTACIEIDNPDKDKCWILVLKRRLSL